MAPNIHRIFDSDGKAPQARRRLVQSLSVAHTLGDIHDSEDDRKELLSP